MDKMYANLFKRQIGVKHKIRFELVSEHPDNEEHRFYSVGRQYISNEIENAKSVGSDSWLDLWAKYLYPFFYSRYIYDDTRVSDSYRLHGN